MKFKWVACFHDSLPSLTLKSVFLADNTTKVVRAARATCVALRDIASCMLIPAVGLAVLEAEVVPGTDATISVATPSTLAVVGIMVAAVSASVVVLAIGCPFPTTWARIVTVAFPFLTLRGHGLECKLAAETPIVNAEAAATVFKLGSFGITVELHCHHPCLVK